MMDPRCSPGYRLTAQETRVLTLLLQGHHKKTAADAMGVSINTVSFHLKNAYCKLGVHSKTEAVVKGLLDGILRPEHAQPQPMTAARSAA
jgi:DNA-binding CsgD family transcriptional regulator